MDFPRLTNTDIRIINYYVLLRDRVGAYKRGHPQCLKWKRETIKRKADEFFDSDKIRYYRGFQDGGIVVAEDSVLMTEDDIAVEVAKVPAVGAHNGGGYPSRYRPEFPQMMLDFFDVGASSTEQVSNDETGEVTRTVLTNALPTKAGFAAKLRVSMYTLRTWATLTNNEGDLRYPEFADAYDIVDAMIENILVTNTLMGKYQPSFAQFYAKNKLGYTDKTDLVLEGGSKPIVSINVNMSPEEAAIIYKEMLGQKE